LLNQMARTPVRLALPLLLLIVVETPVQAQEPATPAPQQREHIVRRGDTLWDLARAYLQNPFLWPLIYEANRSVVEDPHWIYPAERLIIPPVLQQAAADPIGQPIADPIGDPSNEGRVIIPPSEPDPSALEDQEPTVVATLEVRRPAVAPAEYRSAPWLSGAAPVRAAGEITALADPAAASDRLPSTVHPNARVHVAAAAQPGDSLLVIRTGRQVGEHGALVQPLGVLLVETVTGGVATARMVRQFGDAQVGDAVMPLSAVPAIGVGQAEPVQTGPEGHLLEFLQAEPLYGTTDLGFISLGRNAGVGIGDEFGVYVPARMAESAGAAAAAPTQVATIRVIRVDERTATVRVLGASSTALQDGLPVRMIRRMP
jgi:hypothetical protein